MTKWVSVFRDLSMVTAARSAASRWFPLWSRLILRLDRAGLGLDGCTIYHCVCVFSCVLIFCNPMDVSLSELQDLMMDREAWGAVIHGVAKSWTRLSNWTELNWWTIAPRLLCPWDSPGKNTGGGCHFLLQGMFLTQGLNSCLLLGRQILYHWTTGEAPIYHPCEQWFSAKAEAWRLTHSLSVSSITCCYDAYIKSLRKNMLLDHLIYFPGYI